MPTDALRARLGELSDLHAAAALLHWDMLVVMPADGAPVRAEQLATLGRLAHDALVDEDLGALLAAAPDDPVAAVVRRDRERARRVPADLVADLARASAEGHHLWARARATNDFALLAPQLEHVLALRRRYAACFAYEHPYDPLLDDFEPGMTTAEARAVLGTLRDGLRALVEHCRTHAGAVDPGPLSAGAPYDPGAQRALVEAVLAQLGADPRGWRLDVSTHPFQTALARRDVRLTTRYAASSLEALFSALHEFGHALYEAQVDRGLERTPAAGGTSMGVHESQSRTWENMVGRSRGFWRWLTPRLAEHLPVFAGADPDVLWRAANAVVPGPIRVDADEVTYNLHIVLRFELELELVEGTLAVADLPARWTQGMRELLGVEVRDDASGVLQDPHWAEGAFGYFPTYGLGNVLAGQLWAVAGSELGDVDAALAQGDVAALKAWYGDRVHRPGRTLAPRELVRRVTGGPLDPEPLLAYLRAKVEALYGPISTADGLPQEG